MLPVKIKSANGKGTLIVIAVMAVLSAVFAINSFIPCCSVLFGNEFGAAPDFSDIMYILIYYFIPVISCLLLVLFVFLFRKKPAGTMILSVIYLLNALKYCYSMSKSVSNLIDTIKNYTNDNIPINSSIVGSFLLSFMLFAAFVLLTVTAATGFPNRIVAIVPTVVICLANVYSYISIYFIFPLNNDVNDFSTLNHWVGIHSYSIPILMVLAMMLIGLKLPTPPVTALFGQHRTTQKRNKRIERELREYEDTLETLQIQHDSGVISQEHYDEMLAEIHEEMDELKSKMQ